MKKILLGIVTLLLVVLTVPVVNAAKTTKANTKTETKVEETEAINTEGLVKVYLFEAGGCPWCERETAYLEGLESYGKKFYIVKKQSYVDHDTWAHGADYDLAVKVANAFNEAGFKDAAYNGTPMVIISDLYAATAYNTSLEEYINTAFEEGDKDAVQCIADGKENCIRVEEKKNYDTIIIVSIFVVLIGGFAGLMIAGRKK